MKRCEDCHLEAKARIWPCLFFEHCYLKAKDLYQGDNSTGQDFYQGCCVISQLSHGGLHLTIRKSTCLGFWCIFSTFEQIHQLSREREV